MMTQGKCKKCGSPVYSIGLHSAEGLCVTCARVEAARKMSFSTE